MSIILSADHVHVEFDSLVAVRDISVELGGGQLLGLIGPNGAGKTTLLRVLAGLQAPTSGRAYVLGKPVLGEHELVRHHIGFAPDSPPAYEDLTIEQFLRFICLSYHMERSDTEERIDFWLEQLWLTEKRTTKVRHLSRGMRQRVTLARTFIPRPHVILLDEPLSGLDPAGRIQLRKVLTMLRNQGCAMVVSSHILSDLEEVSTHIAIIEHGQILSHSTTGELHRDGASRRTYRATTIAGAESCMDLLRGIEGVTDVALEDSVYTFEFAADEAMVAGLVKRIVALGVPLTSFSELRTSLEDAYLRAGVKQVD